MSLFAELKRRNVFKATAAYLALGWVVTQVTGAVVPALRLPESINSIVVWIGIAGLPFVIAFAWVFEITPEGIRRESEVDRSASITQLTSRRLDYLIIAMLALAMLMFAADRLLPRAPATEGGESQFTAGNAAAPAQDTRPQQDASAVPEATAPRDPAPALVPDDKSIAVLPFVNMSEDPGNEYFSDGIAEELLNLLARIPELRVIARTSSFAFKGKEQDIEEIARKLRVAHVLEGSVRKAGDRVRITAQLVRTSDSTHLWSQTYDRTLEDIFAVQDEIAGAVVEQLKLKLLGSGPKSVEVDPEAYALALQAKHLLRLGSKEGDARAIVLLRQALERQPGYPLALTGLAVAYLAQLSDGLRPQLEARQLAREAAEAALASDPGFASAHRVLGRLAQSNEHGVAEAARHYQRALDVAPADPDGLASTGNLLMLLGRLDQCVELAEFVRQRDPVNVSAHLLLGNCHTLAGRQEEALQALRTAATLSPGYTGVQYRIGLALLLKGDAEAALTAFAAEHGDEEYRVKGTALALHALGRTAEFATAFAELRERWGAQWPSEIAQVYAWTGDAGQAFAWLDKAVAQGEEGLTEQYLNPLYAPLHADPRWPAFRERTGTSAAQLAAIPFEIRLPD